MKVTIYSIVKAISDKIFENRVFLTELDGVIGDGDHGINMSRGFEGVMTIMNEEDCDVGATLKKIGMKLITTVGGASGPLYGTAFLRAGAQVQGDTTVNLVTTEKMLSAAITGIKDRGKATKGEKTMIDALEPALEAIRKGIKDEKTLVESLEMACVAAKMGVEYTKTIRATKGRASYLGDRSIGHQDPGATSSLIIIETITEYCKKNCLEV